MFELIRNNKVNIDQIKNVLLGYLNTALSEGRKFPEVLRLAVPIATTDLLAWLSNQSFEQKIYWYDKQENLEVAGIGAADIVTGPNISMYSSVIQRILKYTSDNCSKCRYYGGFSFYKDTGFGDEWQAFGAYQFILPRFEIVRNGGDDLFICNLIHPDDNNIIQLARDLEQISFKNYTQAAEIPDISNFVNRPDKEKWEEMIISALRHIRNDEYEKIVLARKVEIDLLSPPDPFYLLSVLRNSNHHTVSFGFQPQSGMIFIGTTPEILYRREGGEIISEAVAGTRPRGNNPEEDHILANELLTSEKELREHNYVTRSLDRNLGRLCRHLEADYNVSVLKLSQLQHLYIPFNGSLRPEVTDGDILEALHPTPAVGGYPDKSILPILKTAEPFNRGWYAAPIGWAAANSAIFAVAIRSALIIKNKLILYSGAGIVEGSSPEKEWEELDNKISHYKKVLGVDGKSFEKHQQFLGIPSY